MVVSSKHIPTPQHQTPTTNHLNTNHHHDLPHDGERITRFGSRRHHHSVPAWSARQILRRRFVRDANSSHAVRCILKRGKRKRENIHREREREHTHRERTHTERENTHTEKERENTETPRKDQYSRRCHGVTVSSGHVLTNSHSLAGAYPTEMGGRAATLSSSLLLLLLSSSLLLSSLVVVFSGTR